MSVWILAVLLCSFLLHSTAAAEHGESLTFREGWQRKDFTGSNRFETTDEVLQVDSQASASAYYYEFKEPVVGAFTLSWSWKVSHLLLTQDPELKNNDDYAARVYAVFRYGPFFWQVRSVSYVWTKHKAGQKGYWLNPYSSNMAMIPLDSDKPVSEWQHHRVNPHEDYRRIFAEEPKGLVGIAVMSDTDDTGQTVQAWYQHIQYVLTPDLPEASRSSPPAVPAPAL